MLQWAVTTDTVGMAPAELNKEHVLPALHQYHFLMMVWMPGCRQGGCRGDVQELFGRRC